MISQTTQDYRAIEKVVQDYVDGANGDVPLLKSVFLPTALINGRPIENLFHSVARNGKTNAVARLDYLDINGRAASAKVIIEEWHGYSYAEYLHMLKTAAGWRLVSKVFDEYRD